ncbi:MAG: guanylate kinase [Mahellales bacterium]|jgi:guanylate kinase
MGSKGLLIVISGPSGAGKGTVCRALMKECKDLHLSVSATTRRPRAGETDGKSYFFIDEEKFLDMKEHNAFLEHAQVYGNYYGTPKEYVLNMLNSGRDVLLEIDIQGALQVKETYKDGIFIFIVPPSMDELKQRIIKRGSETEETFKTRFNSAFGELEYCSQYNYVVVNDSVRNASEKIKAIITAEKCKVSRNKDLFASLRGGK